ncbi:MAG: GHKL domain-containing protein [Lachnospiraceae bacterium]|nr:GHKL domain-containing protein [Lachnospiraceae bacterium]
MNQALSYPLTFYIYYWIQFALPLFIVANILMRTYKPRLKESLYIMFVTLFITTLRTVPAFFGIFSTIPIPTVDFSYDNLSYILHRVLIILFLFFYIYKLKGYPVKKAIILTIFTDLFVFTSYFLGLLLRLLLNIPATYFNPLQPLLDFLHAFQTLVLSALFALLFVKGFGNLRKLLQTDQHLQTVLMIGSIITWLSFQIMSTLSFMLEDGYINTWSRALLMGYTIVSLTVFFLYIKYLKAKYNTQEKESELKNLLFYVNEIEQQQTTIRKFKHDYQNILLSIESFFDSDDYSGLQEYYYNKIKTSSQTLTQQSFSLNHLSKIHVKEIKSILAAKLIQAQTMGIDTNFEANEDIDSIFTNSIILVRILGIILDNAIEELDALGKGKLQVACFKQNVSVTFVVRNTCRDHIPPLHELNQLGFSSKGEGRGLGLTNLADLVHSQPNLTLQTSLSKGYFIQKLYIGEL